MERASAAPAPREDLHPSQFPQFGILTHMQSRLGMLLAIALFAILLCTLNAFGVMALSATTVQVLLLAAMVVIIVALWGRGWPWPK